MSRSGKKPIEIAKGVTVTINGQDVAVKGPKGEMKLTLVDDVTVSQGPDGIVVAPREDTQRARAMWGLSRTLVSNLVTGVTTGFTENLEITGVGYRAAMQGKNLQLRLGFSHEVLYEIPEGIEIRVGKPTEISITGKRKPLVGQEYAEIR